MDKLVTGVLVIGSVSVLVLLVVRLSESFKKNEEDAVAREEQKRKDEVRDLALRELRHDFQLVFGVDPFATNGLPVEELIFPDLDKITCRVDLILHETALAAKRLFEEEERLRQAGELSDTFDCISDRVNWQKTFFWSIFEVARKTGTPLRWEVTPETNRNATEAPRPLLIVATEEEARQTYALVQPRLPAYYGDREDLGCYVIPKKPTR